MADPLKEVTNACILKMIWSDCWHISCHVNSWSEVTALLFHFSEIRWTLQGKKALGEPRAAKEVSDVSFGPSLCFSRITLYSSSWCGNSPLPLGTGEVTPGHFTAACELQITNLYNLGISVNKTLINLPFSLTEPKATPTRKLRTTCCQRIF